MSGNQLIIELNQQPIELCKLLKVADLVGGGGEAKVVISEGYVLLNGEVEFQKRKKIYHNDVIEFNGDVLQVIINEDLNDEDTKNTGTDTGINTLENNKSDNLNNEKLDPVPNFSPKAAPETSVNKSPKKRKPISF